MDVPFEPIKKNSKETFSPSPEEEPRTSALLLIHIDSTSVQFNRQHNNPMGPSIQLPLVF